MAVAAEVELSMVVSPNHLLTQIIVKPLPLQMQEDQQRKDRELPQIMAEDDTTAVEQQHHTLQVHGRH